MLNCGTSSVNACFASKMARFSQNERAPTLAEVIR